jgi:hypothetical protein
MGRLFSFQPRKLTRFARVGPPFAQRDAEWQGAAVPRGGFDTRSRILDGAGAFARRHLGELAGVQRLPRHGLDERALWDVRYLLLLDFPTKPTDFSLIMSASRSACMSPRLAAGCGLSCGPCVGGSHSGRCATPRNCSALTSMAPLRSRKSHRNAVCRSSISLAASVVGVAPHRQSTRGY